MTDDHRDRLIAARKKLGLSRRLMAAKLLTPSATYGQWEAGAKRVPGIAVLAAEAAARIRPPKTGTIRNSTDAKIRGLADGRRTAAEVAAAAGISVARVYEAARAAKLAGRPLEFARSTRGGQPQTRRNAAIAEAVRQGSTLAAQGLKYGMSRQAVQQIVLRYGVHASELRKAKSLRTSQEKERLKQDRLREKQRREKPWIDMKLSGLTYKEISARAGVSIRKLEKVFRANNVTRPSVKRDLETRTMIARRWSEGEDAEQLAAEFNTTAGYVKILAYDLGFHRRPAYIREKRTSK